MGKLENLTPGLCQGSQLCKGVLPAGGGGKGDNNMILSGEAPER